MKLFTLIILILTLNSYAEDSKLKTEALNNINFMTEDYPPFNYSQNGKVTGFGTDIIVKVFNELNLKKNAENIMILPWARSYRKVQKVGKRNALFLMGRTTQRENLFKWVGPVPGNKYAIVTYRGGPKVKGIEDLKGEKVVSIRKDIGGHALIDAGFPKDNLMEVSKVKQLFSLIKKKRFKFFSYGLVGLKEKMKTSGFYMEDFKVAFIFKESDLYYAFNKSIEDKTVKKYQKGLNKVMSDEKFLKELKEKYKKKNIYIPL